MANSLTSSKLDSPFVKQRRSPSARRTQAPSDGLSAAELRVLTELASGSSNQEIAVTLFVSVSIIKTHLVHIYQKLGVSRRTQAINVARQRKIIP